MNAMQALSRPIWTTYIARAKCNIAYRRISHLCCFSFDTFRLLRVTVDQPISSKLECGLAHFVQPNSYHNLTFTWLAEGRQTWDVSRVTTRGRRRRTRIRNIWFYSFTKHDAYWTCSFLFDALPNMDSSFDLYIDFVCTCPPARHSLRERSKYAGSDSDQNFRLEIW